MVKGAWHRSWGAEGRELHSRAGQNSYRVWWERALPNVADLDQFRENKHWNYNKELVLMDQKSLWTCFVHDNLFPL